MSTEYEQKLVTIDWKFVGRDYMEFFPQYYPDLPFLFSQEWDDLCDAVANEMPDNLFDDFSSFLAIYGYELWNLDDDSDSYHLCLVAANQSATFETEWSTNAHCKPRRLGLQIASRPMSAQAQICSPRKKKKVCFVDLDYHLEYGGIHDRNSCQVQLIDYESEGQTYYGVADLDKFPFEILEAEGFYQKLDQGYKLYPLYTRSPAQYWELVSPELESESTSQPPHKKIIVLNNLHHFDYEEIDGAVFPSDAYLYRATYANSLFIVNNRCVYRIQGSTMDSIGEIDFELSNMLALNADEVVLINLDSDRPNLVLINAETKTFARLNNEFVAEDAFIINEDEIGFIKKESSPHPEVNYIFQTKAFLGRFNIRTSQVQYALLDGLHHDYQWDPSVFKSQPKPKIRVKSFEGFIIPQTGHQDWVVLNYISNCSGKHDLAWLWNKSNDTILKIVPADFPRIEPVISYVAAIGRYLADESCRTYLMIEFDEIVKTRKAYKLTWDIVESS